MEKYGVKQFKYLHSVNSITASTLKELKQFLMDASKHYYETDHKLISDDDYDRLNEIYEEYTGDLWYGSKGSKKVSHKYNNLMGTLKKVNSLGELEEWLISNNVSSKTTIGISNKLDGNSIMIEYGLDGKAISAVTRGKDGEGEDVFHIFKNHWLPYDLEEPMAVKYEVNMLKSNMEEASRIRGKELVDPRSAVSGILHRDDADKYVHLLTLAPLEISDEVTPRSERMDFCNDISWNNPAMLQPKFRKISGTLPEIIAGITKIYDMNVQDRLNWDFLVDGMVIEFLEEEDRERLGWHKGSSIYPKFAIALKYPAIEQCTKAIDIEFDFGSTGRVTPCVVFEPVVINGRTFRRTSIANYKRFKELKIGKGSDLIFALRNDVLGYIDVLDNEANKKIIPFKFITVCPHCGEDLVLNDNETYVYCENDNCNTHVLGQLVRWFRKLNLKGIAESTLQKLIDAELVTSIPSLYGLKDFKAEAAAIPGLGSKSIAEVLNIINSKKTVKDYEVLSVICPEGIGRSTLKPFLEANKLSDVLLMTKNKKMEKLLATEGISEINAEKICEGMDHYILEWALGGHDITVEETYKSSKKGDGMKVCITGKINNFKNRDEFVAAIEAKGHSFVDSVTKNCDILVTNDSGSGSSKNKKAAELGKPIMTEDEFCKKYLN
jgi:DNA ligase (NAD+)